MIFLLLLSSFCVYVNGYMVDVNVVNVNDDDDDGGDGDDLMV